MEELLTYREHLGIRPLKWTRERYGRMAEAGILTEDDRVELVNGEIIEMSPQSSRHATAIRAVSETLRPIFGDGYDIRVQLPLALGERDEPEPDVSVVRGSFREFADRHPSSAALVVEVADTSLPFDRLLKLRAYARAGIQEYWIVNLQADTIEIYRDPEEDTFRTRRTCQANEVIGTVETPEARISVKDLLP